VGQQCILTRPLVRPSAGWALEGDLVSRQSTEGFDVRDDPSRYFVPVTGQRIKTMKSMARPLPPERKTTASAPSVLGYSWPVILRREHWCGVLPTHKKECW
jgi:hypothetical protein